MAEHTKHTVINLGFNEIGHAEGCVELQAEIDGEPCSVIISYEARKQELYQTFRVNVPEPDRVARIEGNTTRFDYNRFTHSQHIYRQAVESTGEGK